MASVEQQDPGLTTNGGPATTIAVENPATGEVVGTVRQIEPAEVREMARRGRAAPHRLQRRLRLPPGGAPRPEPGHPHQHHPLRHRPFDAGGVERDRARVVG